MEILSNEKVRLRAVEPTDAEVIFKIERNDIGKADSCWYAPISFESVLQYALNYDADPFAAKGVRLVIEERVDKKIVGLIDLYELDKANSRAFVAIYILEEYRNLGFGKGALEILCRYADKVLGLHQLVAKVIEDNDNSFKLFLSCGFEAGTELKDWLYDASSRCYRKVTVYQKIFS